MMASLAGSKNPRWRGGLTMDPRGYPKLLVGRDHPLADPSGYAYVHHLVLAAAGIRVEPGQATHHRNGDKQDFRYANLAVVDHAEHSREHSATQPRQRGKFARRGMDALAEALLSDTGGTR